jgi:hypothetical protein
MMPARLRDRPFYKALLSKVQPDISPENQQPDQLSEATLQARS